jgi:hypothetical protein
MICISLTTSILTAFCAKSPLEFKFMDWALLIFVNKQAQIFKDCMFCVSLGKLLSWVQNFDMTHS